MVLNNTVRVLFLSDTHLGFDYALRPRVDRRRRGPEFFEAARRALEPARRGEVDLVVHGGDLLFRSRVRPWLVARALEPLLEVAERGTPVFVVPGNHERGRIPFAMLAAHRNLHIFDRPRSFVQKVGAVRVCLSGFPSRGRKVRSEFAGLVEKTRWRNEKADINLLCIHEAFEGATVGPSDYTFTYSPDTVRAADLPEGFDAVLAGHIHRHQVLSSDLAGRELPCPVIYSGSTCRTSFAEAGEQKGYVLVDLAPGRRPAHTFRRLYSRPMVTVELNCSDPEAPNIGLQVEQELRRCPPDAIVRIRLRGRPQEKDLRFLRADFLRRVAPRGVSVQLCRNTIGLLRSLQERGHTRADAAKPACGHAHRRFQRERDSARRTEP